MREAAEEEGERASWIRDLSGGRRLLPYGLLVPLLFVLAIPGIASAHRAPAARPPESPPVASAGATNPAPRTAGNSMAPVGYSMAPVKGGLRGLRRQYSPEQLELLEKLNRRNLEHLARLDSVIVPDTWTADPLASGQMPEHYAWADSMPKALVLYQPGQIFGAYEHGRLVRWGPVSSGRNGNATPAGLYHLNWKSRGRHSTDNPKWYMPWYFNFDNDHGFSLHEYDLPGYPASHACVRLLEPDAVWLWQWGSGWELGPRGWTVLRPGTPFLVVGCYDYAAPPPWNDLSWDGRRIDLPQDPDRTHRSCDSPSARR